VERTTFIVSFTVIYTRDGDIETDDLGFRAQFANFQEADLFISIHCNAAEDADANGVEVYHYPDSSEGMLLANQIQKLLVVTTPLKDRGVKEADFAVLRLADMPAVLVECGFLSSEKDREFVIDGQQQASLALGIAAGINRYHIA